MKIFVSGFIVRLFPFADLTVLQCLEYKVSGPLNDQQSDYLYQ